MAQHDSSVRFCLQQFLPIELLLSLVSLLYFVVILSIINTYYELEKVLKICITFLRQSKSTQKANA